MVKVTSSPFESLRSSVAWMKVPRTVSRHPCTEKIGEPASKNTVVSAWRLLVAVSKKIRIARSIEERSRFIVYFMRRRCPFLGSGLSDFSSVDSAGFSLAFGSSD